MKELIIRTDMTVIAGVFFVVLVAVGEGGYRLGLAKFQKVDEPTRSQITTIEAAVLGMLALLLGFSFSLAAGRYELSKTLLREEANAIGTTYLRTGMLPAEHGRSIAGMLRQYTDLRLASYDARSGTAELAAIYEKTDELHRKIWAEAEAVAAIDGHSIITGLFVQSLNEMIDIEGKQRSAIVNRAPALIFGLLIFMSVAAIGIVGYAFGTAATRRTWIFVLLALLLAAIIMVIGDMHRPRRGLIQINTNALVDVRQTMDIKSMR
jgi:hypothetical protein